MIFQCFACSLLAVFLAVPVDNLASKETPSNTATSEEQLIVPNDDSLVLERPRVVVSTQKVAIAEPFTVRVEMIAPAGSRVAFAPVDETLGPFDVLRVADTPDVPAPGMASDQRLWARILVLETLALGTQTIPPIEVSVQTGDENATTQTTKSEPLTIEVQSVLEPEEQAALNEFRDIEGEITLKKVAEPVDTDLQWWPIAAVALGVAVGAFAVWYRRRDRVMKWCRKRLAELRQQPISDAEDYIAASDLLKQVLHLGVMGRDRSKVSRLTTATPSTRRLIEMLGEQEYGDAELERLGTAFRYADRLKFDSRSDRGVSGEEADALRTAIDDAERQLSSRRDTGSVSKEAA
ncbi:DUF4381 family protein [Aporhodopirellula aestuarii]|uniref:DUF4381 domain-containing protein n=1 Tax=Aporhodopirellula aestuarii TaxID=2950107 RepID=A0ABT0U3J1_9BACT|nr:DUF4381 family protein [Aporhodopirellula aestuarii]MCM2371376.1 DUF4381 domain-containing protein [Aporhodopirellula aestuarii]